MTLFLDLRPNTELSHWLKVGSKRIPQLLALGLTALVLVLAPASSMAQETSSIFHLRSEITLAIPSAGSGGFVDPLAIDNSRQLPAKFLGWGVASRLGDSYAARFERQRMRSISAMREASSASQPITTAEIGLDLLGSISTGYLPSAVVCADFNHDGNLDLAVSMGGDSTVWVYAGRGDGTFNPPHLIALSGVSPVDMVGTDLNGDGNVDLVIAESDTQTLGVLIGRPDGSFDSELTYSVPNPPLSVTAADFNNDGFPDVAVGMSASSAHLGIAYLENDGTGTLRAPLTSETYSNAPFVVSLTTGEFNHDGYPELVISDWADYGGGSFVMLNTKDGHFSIGDSPGAGYRVVVGDVDEDGFDDVVLTGSGLFYVALGTQDGTLTFDHTLKNAYGVGAEGFQPILADFNNDGHLDIATTPIAIGTDERGQDSGSLLTVHAGNGKGDFGVAREYRGHTSAFSGLSVDLNRDGAVDVVTVNQDLDDLTVYLNKGDGTFGGPTGTYIGYMRPELYETGRALNAPVSKSVFADFNGDSRPDVLTIGRPTGRIEAIAALQSNDGTFDQKKYSSLVQGFSFYVWDLIVGDFRNSGNSDLIIFLFDDLKYQSTFVFARSEGDGSFIPSSPVMLPKITCAAAGDLNRDGKLDFVVVGATAAVPYLGAGDGTFSAGTAADFSSIATDAYETYVRDFTGDGIPDVLLQVHGGGLRGILLEGKGDGSFKPARVAISDLPRFAVGDFNQDGLPDVVSFHYFADSTIKIWLNRNGNFEKSEEHVIPDSDRLWAPTQEYAGRNSNVSTVADYDGDGKLDLLVFPVEPRSLHTVVSAQFLRGNGDGSFDVSPIRYNLFADSAPTSAFDMDGDGRAELIETDGRLSSFHIIRTKQAPSISLRMTNNPVIGVQGSVQVSLSAVQATDVVVTLSVNEPRVTVPATATIPANSLGVDVPVSIVERASEDIPFVIEATLGEEATTTTGVFAGMANPAGIDATVLYFGTLLPGDSVPIDVRLQTFGSYEGNVSFSCENVPESVTCAVSPSSLRVTRDTFTGLKINLATATTLAPGTYAPKFVISDGSAKWSRELDLRIGDFTIEVPEPAKTYPYGSMFMNFIASVTLINGLDASKLVVSCDGVPTPAKCNETFAGEPTTIRITKGETLPPGEYPFRIFASQGAITKSVPATLTIVATGPPDFNILTFAGTALTVPKGSSGTLSLSFGAVQGFSGTVSLSCTNLPVNASCNFSPSSLLVAGPNTQDVVLTFSTRKSSSMRAAVNGLSMAFAMIVPGVVVAGIRRRKLTRSSVVLLIVTTVLLGCGGGGGTSGGGGTPPPSFSDTPAGSYSFNVVAQSGSISHSQVINLIVQ